MMLKIGNPSRETELETAVLITETHPYIISLIRALDAFQAATVPAVSRVQLSLIAGTDYLYRIEDASGRTWTQTIRIPPLPDRATMTFDVPSFWALEEFALQRPVRDLFVSLVRDFGLTEAKIEWM